LSRAANFVLGYHGCDRALGEKLVRRDESFTTTDEPYHWLGAGVYFWEADPVRAFEWAKKKQARGACHDPFVVGAVIDLGNCLDLQVRENLALMQDAYEAFAAERAALSLALPVNKTAKNDQSETKVLRFLDCAVIESLHQASEKRGIKFDSVRGAFSEGEGIYPGSGILQLTHSQIAVRNLACIKGVFIAP
jgi:hypothetical protein